MSKQWWRMTEEVVEFQSPTVLSSVWRRNSIKGTWLSCLVFVCEWAREDLIHERDRTLYFKQHGGWWTVTTWPNCNPESFWWWLWAWYYLWVRRKGIPPWVFLLLISFLNLIVICGNCLFWQVEKYTLAFSRNHYFNCRSRTIIIKPVQEEGTNTLTVQLLF